MPQGGLFQTLVLGTGSLPADWSCLAHCERVHALCGWLSVSLSPPTPFTSVPFYQNVLADLCMCAGLGGLEGVGSGCGSKPFYLLTILSQHSELDSAMCLADHTLRSVQRFRPLAAEVELLV